MSKRPFDKGAFMDSIGVTELTGEEGYTDLEKILGLKSVFQRFGH